VAEVARWVISVFSFSKSYAMTGWRVGYLCADQRIVDECLKVSQFSVTSLSPFAQAGAHAALAHDEVQAYAADMRARYQARRDYLVELTRGSWVEGALLSPQGAFYALIDCSSLCDDSYPLAQRLVMDHGVAFTPGLAFGDDMSRYLRLCFATAEPNIARAVDAITSAV
jgi:aspartate/methionine/tyrosine aminotransferase